MTADQLFERLGNLPEKQQLRVLYRIYGVIENHYPKALKVVEKIVTDLEKEE